MTSIEKATAEIMAKFDVRFKTKDEELFKLRFRLEELQTELAEVKDGQLQALREPEVRFVEKRNSFP